jgi:eukaryotic-like serine/threonine-protein kinase
MREDRPDQIGRYQLLSELGRGGFGRVYHGYDPIIGRPVAVKILTK